jgi:RNA polymerase sigma-70 factor (ECF subfamily)
MLDRESDLANSLERARAGDSEAQRKLVEVLYPLVAKVVRAYVPRGGEAEDWIQEVFLRVFTGLAQYRGQAPVEHWVARIAVNTCLDQLRARKRRPVVLWTDLTEKERSLLSTSLATEPAVDVAEALAARELVGKLLDGLSPEDRVVLQMLDLEERSVAEVATLLGWSKVGVKVRAFRARRKLRKRLQQLLGEASHD